MRRGKIIAALGLICLLIALGFVVYNVWDDYRASQQSASILKEIKEREPSSSSGVPAYELAPHMDMPVMMIDGYPYVGYVAIPALGLELPVMEEWSYPNLQISPCRYSGTPYMKNFVIAAHNYQSHFGRIKELKPGDEVIFTDMAHNIFTYKVADLELLGPKDTDQMTAGKSALTLFTCTLDGGQRVTVRCDEVSNKASEQSMVDEYSAAVKAAI